MSLFDFENEGFFAAAGQGHMNSFCLLTVGDPSCGRKSRFLFRGQSPFDILDENRTFELSGRDFALLVLREFRGRALN